MAKKNADSIIKIKPFDSNLLIMIVLSFIDK